MGKPPEWRFDMRKLLLLTTALVALAGAAHAADQNPPLKAPPSNEFTSWNNSGWYYGLGGYAGEQQASVNGSSLLIPSLISSNINASGGGVEVVVGHISGNTNVLGFGNWTLWELKVAYQNIQGANQVSGGSSGFTSRWSATQDVCVGADVFAAIASVVGNLGIGAWPTWAPSLPSAVQVGVPKQCLGVEIREFGLGGQFGGATGTSFGIAPGPITQWIYPTLGTNGRPNGGAVKAWASVDWNTKGFTFDNLFGKTGPVGVTPGVGRGTGYFGGVQILFAAK
jgi:hypothetical protein